MSPLIGDGRNNDNSASAPVCARLLLAMAGLPGTGKSTIAAELAKRLHALVLNKDDIRAKLFPGEATDYSREQDDFCMEVIFRIAEQVLNRDPERTIIIDGRTFTRSYQVHQLFSRAESSHCRPAIIECICDDAVAEQRITNARLIGEHPAGNRTYALYSDLKGTADPIAVERLIIDTGRERLETCVERCLAYVEMNRRFKASR